MENTYLESMIDLRANMIFTEISFIDSVDSMMNNRYLTESAIYDFGEKLSNFIKKIVINMKYFCKTIQNDVKKTYEKLNVKRKLKEEREKLLAEPNKKKKYHTFDIEKFNETYEKYYRKIINMYNKLATPKKFKSRDSLNYEMDKFNTLLDEFEERMINILEKKDKEYTLDQRLLFIEDVINGNSKVIQTYIKYSHDLEELSNKAEKLMEITPLTPDDELLKKEWFTLFKKSTSNIPKKLSKITSKAVFGMAFLMV